MLGVECVSALSAQGRRMAFPIEVVAFGDEEGSRFHASMLCSRAFAGVLEPEALKVVDGDAIPVLKALADFPLRAEGGIASAAHGPALAFIEAHIEQGPVLEAEGLAVGVVSGIAAQLRYQVSMEGKAGHAGTNAMHLRRDALAGAAEAISAIERIANDTRRVVLATVGKLAVRPGAVNVVPGGVDFSIDVRSGDEAERDAAAERIITTLREISHSRGLVLKIAKVQDLPATPCDSRLTSLLEGAMVAAGHPPRILVSGAGHDAMVLSALCPTAMLFIRCEGGVSHNRAEAVSAEDVEAAFETLSLFIDKLDAANGR
jgi:allantoate deiminase